MPWGKASAVVGAYDSYEIVSINIDIDQKCVTVGLRVVTIDSTGIPRSSRLDVSLRDEDRMIIDPAWDGTYTPPKPAGFDENDANTWAGLTADQFPKVLDPAGQHFTALAASDPTGTTIYGRLKVGLYAALSTAGHIPSGQGWAVL